MSEVEADPDVEVDVDTYTVETIMRRIAEDVALVVDRPFVIESLKASREEKRPSGKGKVHISFKLEVQQESGVAHGCLLVPLPDAISLACSSSVARPMAPCAGSRRERRRAEPAARG
jgi:hypothetical protein